MSTSISIKPEEFSATISRQLDTLSQEVIERANKAAQTVAKETVSELKQTSPVRSGRSKNRRASGTYAKGWKQKKQPSVITDNYEVYNTWYQLEHLLEFGHALRQGGRARAIPHIAPAEANAEKRFLEELYKECNNL